MTAYEFTRFESEFLSQVSFKHEGYDANILARNIIDRNPSKDIRNMPKYKDAKDTFIDLTMSCTSQEADGWMRYWMANAIAYGKKTQNTDWMFFFLAAYDISKSLCSI